MSNNTFCLIDLEATCDEPQFDRDQMEIIEIGACLVDKDLKIISEFQTYIKPVVNPQLSAFCTQLTTITQSDVDAAPGFAEAMTALDAWLEQCASSFGPVAGWGSWGAYDKKQFDRNAVLLNLPAPGISQRHHLNVKQVYADALGLKRHSPGLGKALRYENLIFVGTAHRGIDDAKNIAQLLPVAFGRTESVWRDRPALTNLNAGKEFF